MKYLFIILFFGTNIITKCFSQDITPFRTSEFCPNTEYTFTVSIPKPYDRMIGVGGCFVTQLPTPPVGTTFTFKGKFGTQT